jgi:UDP-N-acetylglucosamine--N-acetylmuramyl-(pentapeptide) pyrophosphoryl-undecaprenol N-acetylglucosamine transferase
MELAYLAADIIVARAGAGTCAEIEAMGIPTIFIPLSIGNGEQIANAERYVTHGSAKILLNINLTPQDLLSNILEVNKSFTEISRLAIANKSSKLSAASDFVDLIDNEIFRSRKEGF